MEDTLPITLDPLFVSFAVALGIGLLIGTERERRKAGQPRGSVAGLRTFAIASLTGAAAMAAGGVILLVAATLAVTVLVAVSYWSDHESDPGLTTEIALVATVLLGGLAIGQPTLATASGVAVTVLLAARSWVHRVVSSVLTESEIRDGLIFAAATFIVLPLLPDSAIDPFGALNLRSIWTVVVLVMGISAVGYVAVRVFGARFGLPIAGFASGFISSTATIGAMGTRALKSPEAMGPAVAGAILSTVATVIQMALVLSATSIPVVAEMALVLSLAGAAALLYAAIFSVRTRQRKPEVAEARHGRAFSLRAAVFFAVTLAVVLIVAAVLRESFGSAGLLAAAALGGLVDTHSSAIAVASLVAAGKIAPAEAVLPILAAFSTNTVSKIVFAMASGGGAFALRVVPGLILVAAAAWIGAWLVWPLV